MVATLQVSQGPAGASKGNAKTCASEISRSTSLRESLPRNRTSAPSCPRLAIAAWTRAEPLPIHVPLVMLDPPRDVPDDMERRVRHALANLRPHLEEASQAPAPRSQPN